MFVYNLDRCLSQYWKLFFLGLGVAGLGIALMFAVSSLRARGRRRALARQGISGAAFERADLTVSRHAAWAVMVFVASVALFLWYIDFYSDFQCTPASIFWIDRR